MKASQLHGSGSKEQEYLEGWKRSRAELVNFRRRQQEREATVLTSAKRQVLEPLLSLADNFRAIAAHVPPEVGESEWTKGVLLVARQLEHMLSAYGVDRIDDAAAAFDPRQHEAIAEVKADGKKSGAIVEVVQVGYRVGEAVIRPAKVKVAL